MSDTFQKELRFLGIDSSPVFVREPEGHGIAERYSRKPYSDVQVRRAITYAIDRPEILKGAMFGLGRILGTNVDPLNPYFVDLANAMPYDPAKAKKLLPRPATRTASTPC